MTSCIVTVIKNEQEYLDEWIQYHLNLGVNHLFIFEDYDSNSHKKICDKYKDHVTLNSIFSILNETNKNKALNVKKTHKWNVQHLYYRNALIWIKNTFIDKYDWCFVIDNDEFITIENKSLQDILQLYKDYDAFTIQWECYGANGLINKPDYSKHGLIETYKEKAKGKIIDNVASFIKTCYNIKKYKNDFFYNQHHPNDKCNWCNTKFIKHYYETPCYTNIYLRHYITKSWEEYVYKIKQRGFTWGGARNFDFFFTLNIDMINKKQELLNELKKETLVILPYKETGSQGNELKIALKCWKKFCSFKYHFIVIGEFNVELKKEFPWVEFIYCPEIQKIEGQYNPNLDSQHRINVVMKKYDKIYDGFIWMNDDFYAIKKFELKDITTPHYLKLSFKGENDKPASYWSHTKWKTKQLLIKENLTAINYSTHYPYYFEFSKLKEIFNKYNMLNESYILEDIYFNYFKHEDPIHVGSIRLGIWNKEIYDNEFNNAVNNSHIKFVCNSVNGWCKELEDSLEQIIKEST